MGSSGIHIYSVPPARVCADERPIGNTSVTPPRRRAIAFLHLRVCRPSSCLCPLTRSHPTSLLNCSSFFLPFLHRLRPALTCHLPPVSLLTLTASPSTPRSFLYLHTSLASPRPPYPTRPTTSLDHFTRDLHLTDLEPTYRVAPRLRRPHVALLRSEVQTRR